MVVAEPSRRARTYADWCRLLAGERLPAAVVDLDCFNRNLNELALLARSGNKRLRIATKSLRVPVLIERALRFGPPLDGIMCYAAGELTYWADKRVRNLLLGYPTFQPDDLRTVRTVHESGAVVTVMVDDAAGIACVAEALRGCARPLRVAIEYDVSDRPLGGVGPLHIGVRRSPVRSVDALAALIDEAKRHKEVELVGAMAYEAQVAGLADRNPHEKLRNPIATQIRRRAVKTVAAARKRIARVFADRNIPLQLFNGGGTGSLSYAVAESPLTEVTAGSGLLCSHLFDYYSNLALEPACFFALQAVRSSERGYVTCQGGGYIASGAPSWDRQPLPHAPAGTRLVAMEGCGEVQTPLQLPAGIEIPHGAPVIFRPAKAGEMAERFNEYLLVSDGKIVDRVKTYRGLGLCFY